MLKLDRVTKVKVFYLLLVYVFNFDLAEFSAAISEKGLFETYLMRLLAEMKRRVIPARKFKFFTST